MKPIVAGVGAVFLILAAAPVVMAQPFLPGRGQSVEPVKGDGVILSGVVCPLLRLDDGRLFALQGPLGTLGARPAPGTRVRIEGRPVAFSTCQQGQALAVDKIEVLPQAL